MNILKKHWIFFIFYALLILLIFKDPFSGQNSISNLDPYPDALMYLTASKNLVNEGNLKVTYENIQLDSTIPPLYSIIIAPSYFIFRDPRAFYFVNIGLTLISALFFYKIIFKLFESKLIRFILFLAFVSNFIIFRYPSVAMAENLLICLFIISTFLLIGPLNVKRSILLGLLTTAFFATKYMAWTLSFSLLISFFLLALSQKVRTAQKFNLITWYLLSLIASFTILMLIESFTKEQNLFDQLKIYLQHVVNILNLSPTGESAGSSFSASKNAAFSQSYFKTNLLRYFAGLIGGPTPAAGKDLIILPIVIGMSSIVGIFINVFFSRLKLLSFYFLMAFSTTLLYILFFFATDARYLFAIIPAQIIVFGISLSILLGFLRRKDLSLSSSVIILIVLASTTLNVYPGILNQLKANFLGNDSSKGYQTVVFFNQNFNHPKPGKKPFIISTLPPLMTDFYSNQNYKLLPFSRFQNFMYKPEIWDIPENSDLFELYKQYLKNGEEIYLSDHNTEYSSLYSYSYLFYKEKFTLNPVSTGCKNQCNLYRLELKGASFNTQSSRLSKILQTLKTEKQ